MPFYLRDGYLLPQIACLRLPPKADMCSALAYVCYGPRADIHVQSRHFAKQSACPLWPCRREPACAGTKVTYSEFVANLRRPRVDAVKAVVTHLGTSHLGDHFSAGVSELHARFRLCPSLVMQKI